MRSAMPELHAGGVGREGLRAPARQLELVYHGEAAGERVAAAERRVELLYRVR
jgi:hypothetical protein